MTRETTSSSEPMSCERVAAEDIAEAYLLERLSEEDRTAFEQHYFECSRCFEELRTLESVGDHLRADSPVRSAPPARSRLWLTAAGMAAVLVLATLAVLWRGPQTETEPPVATPVATPAANPQPAQVAPGVDPASPAEPPSSLEQIARVEPAPYNPGTFRTVPDAATTRFQQGMERYQTADYRGAAAALREAAMLDPDAAHIRFFLGVSQLLLGETEGAIVSLRATIALGDTPYLEESHLYLAKAFLRHGNINAAQTHWKAVVALEGPRSAEANRILERTGRLIP